jgi:putative transposase
MTRPLSNDLRERIIGAVEGGMSCNAAAKVYKVAVSAVIKLVQRWKATGSFEAKPMGGYRGHKLSEHKELVQCLVQEKPDITLAELRAKLKAHKIKVGQTSIFRFLNYLNLSYKKNRSRQRTRAA